MKIVCFGSYFAETQYMSDAELITWARNMAPVDVSGWSAYIDYSSWCVVFSKD